MALVYIGGALALIGHIWIVVLAFQRSVLWGILSLCVPFVGIIFCILNWSVAKTALIVYIIGGVMSGVGQARMRASYEPPPQFKV